MTGPAAGKFAFSTPLPSTSGTPNTSFKCTQGKALKHSLSLLWQISSTSFFLLMVTEKIAQSKQDIDMLLAS